MKWGKNRLKPTFLFHAVFEEYQVGDKSHSHSSAAKSCLWGKVNKFIMTDSFPTHIPTHMYPTKMNLLLSIKDCYHEFISPRLKLEIATTSMSWQTGWYKRQVRHLSLCASLSISRQSPPQWLRPLPADVLRSSWHACSSKDDERAIRVHAVIT